MKNQKKTPVSQQLFLKYGLLCVVCIGSTVCFTGCGDKTTKEHVEVVRPVKMMTLGESGAVGLLEYPGTIEAAQELEMAFEVPGKIVDFPVVEGEDVGKGALLARLDTEDLQAARDADRARQRATKAEYDRYQDLYANSAVSLQELEVRRRQFEVADATLKRSEKALRDTRLVAPFAGRVARKVVGNYDNVQAKQPVLLLQDVSGLQIVVNVPENDAVRARRGMESAPARDVKPRVSISSVPGHNFAATLKEFATSADPVTRTFKMTFAFESPADVNILPGMTAKLTIDVSGAKLAGGSGSLSVPSAAVVADEGGNSFVWVVDTGTMKVSRRVVEVGEMSGANIVIRGGLSSGETIAVSGAQHLRDGMQVRRFGN